MMRLIMKSISVSLVAHFSTVEVAQFCIVGNNAYRLFAFFSFFSARFSFNVFSGFFLTVFFESWPLAINLSFNFIDKILNGYQLWVTRAHND
jgi:hypothetical protein